MELVEITGAIRRLELMRRIRKRRLLVQCGLHPGQPPILAFVSEHPGCNQRMIADELDITPASCASSLKRLEKAGMLVRIQDRADSRQNILNLTEKGAVRVKSAYEEFSRLDRIMFNGISDEELAQYKSLCDRMFENLADESTRNLNICRLHSAAEELLKEKEGE